MIDEKRLIEEFRKYHSELKPRYVSKLVDAEILDLIDIVNEQPKVGEWIPCSDRLPKCNWGCETEALLYQLKDSGTIEVGYYGEGGLWRDRYFRVYRDGYDGVDVSSVIAWMPLPEPYNADMRKKVE